jgi:uncharacterized protein (TIGR02757 family)
LERLKEFLDARVERYNTPAFLEGDPVSIPHRFSRREDVEIAGFLAATLAWGQRGTIVRKCSELLRLMDDAPYAFVVHHGEEDLRRLLHFRHRTFNATDALYFIAFFRHVYTVYGSLEALIAGGIPEGAETVEAGLNRLRAEFVGLDEFPARTGKHLASPDRNSACKRINMFLRWMVRDDRKGVDFGLWKRIRPAQLVCPCDLHVERTARGLGLITRRQTDWRTALELTRNLRQLDARDPVRYDFALFGIGAFEGGL